MGESKKTEDLLDSTMSLGDHLEELRMRIIRALLGLVLGCIIALVFGRSIVNFLEGPYNDATAEFLFRVDLDYQADLDKGIIPDGLRQSFMDNGAALSAGATAKKKGYLLSGRRWLISADNNSKDKNKYSIKKEKNQLNIYELVPLQIIAVAAGFTSYIQIALVAGLLLSSPWVFYQLWMFVAAGLYPHEKRYVYMAAPFTAILFICGAIFFLIIVAPLTLKFMVGFNQRILDVRSQFTFQHYISFVSHLMLVFGLAFQTPIAIFFLNMTGLVSIAALNKSRKFVILLIFIVAAIATPGPDVISQIMLAVPLWLLFELGILLSYLESQRRKSQDKK